VTGLENAVFGGIDCFGLLLGRLSPEQEDHVIALFIDCRNHVVRELLPAALGVGVWQTVLYG
jgi:hypothetical protein